MLLECLGPCSEFSELICLMTTFLPKTSHERMINRYVFLLKLSLPVSKHTCTRSVKLSIVRQWLSQPTEKRTHLCMEILLEVPFELINILFRQRSNEIVGELHACFFEIISHSNVEPPSSTSVSTHTHIEEWYCTGRKVGHWKSDTSYQYEKLGENLYVKATNFSCAKWACLEQ